MRWFFLVFILFAMLFVAVWGLPESKSKNRPVLLFPDMDFQYKVKYQKSSDFFANGQAARLPVTGTVPIGFELPDKPVSEGGQVTNGFATSDDYWSTGQIGNVFGDGFPAEVTVDEKFLDRGEERFAIYCAICHGDSGNGKGVVANYWPGGQLTPNANLMGDRALGLPDGQIFWTITHGNGGLMGPYGGNIPVEDRWAITAYVRALQLSQKADTSKADIKKAFEDSLKVTPPTE